MNSIMGIHKRKNVCTQKTTLDDNLMLQRIHRREFLDIEKEQQVQFTKIGDID